MASSEQARTSNPNLIGWDDQRRKDNSAGFSMPFVNHDLCAASQLSVHISVVQPGERAHPPHRHAGEETMYVLAGRADATIGDETHPIEAGMALFCPEQVLHGLRNIGDEPLKYMVIRIPVEFAESAGRSAVR